MGVAGKPEHPPCHTGQNIRVTTPSSEEKLRAAGSGARTCTTRQQGEAWGSDVWLEPSVCWRVGSFRGIKHPRRSKGRVPFRRRAEDLKHERETGALRRDGGAFLEDEPTVGGVRGVPVPTEDI